MENWNAYMDVLFNLQEIRQMGGTFWLYAIILLLVTTAVILIAAGLRSRRENDGAVADGDGEINSRKLSDIKAGETDVSDRSANVRNTGDRSIVDRNVGGRNAGDGNTNESGMPAIIIDALGGMDNIYNLACSDTRLRVTVNDGTLVNRMRLKSSGALGVLAKGRQVQVFYENQVERICRELKRYIESHRYVESEQEDVDYERVLKKVYVPVEGDIVRVSDIHCLQNVGDGNIGVCAVRASRGEIRAPFDCKVRYDKAGEGTLMCESEEGYIAEIRLVADGVRDWKRVSQQVSISLLCDVDKRVRKGRLLAEYPYETFSGMGDKVYAVIKINGNTGRLKVNMGERVNYEYAICEIVE